MFFCPELQVSVRGSQIKRLPRGEERKAISSFSRIHLLLSQNVQAQAIHYALHSIHSSKLVHKLLFFSACSVELAAESEQTGVN